MTPRRTRQDEWLGGACGRLCFDPRSEQERQTGHRSFLGDDGEEAQREFMFLRRSEIGVIVVGWVTVREMDMDDGAVCVVGQLVVVMIVSLGGVQMQEWRCKECQKHGQPSVRRERSPHGAHY